MSQNVFYSGLNEFCLKYLVDSGRPLSLPDRAALPQAIKQQHDFLFENLMLFDRVTFKVHGENIPLVFLIRTLGEHTFEALLEQNAFGFALWTPNIVFLVKNIPGLEGLASGVLNSPAHADPEQSIELGLKWLPDPLSQRAKKRLIKKVHPLYKLPDSGLSAKATSIVKDAVRSGRLSNYGLNNISPALDDLSTEDKKKLVGCANDLLEYHFLMANDMTSFSEYKYFSPFWDTTERFKRASNIKEGFARILDVEGFPDMAALAAEVKDPLTRLARLRNKRSARQMRLWLSKTTESNLDPEFVKEYIAAVAERKDLASSAGGKFLKSIIMTAIGAGIGLAGEQIAGPTGLPVGSLMVPGAALGWAGTQGLDMLDRFAIDGLGRGWTPRMFLNDITKMRKAG